MEDIWNMDETDVTIIQISNNIVDPKLTSRCNNMW